MLLFNTVMYSQNLVINGDFEEFNNDNYVPNSNLMGFKDSYFTKKFNFCPMSSFGWGDVQYTQFKHIPHSGNAYKNITTYNKVKFEDNLYYYSNAQGKICKPLLKNKKYLVEFYVKQLRGDYFSDKLEVLITDTLDIDLIHREFKVIKTKKRYRTIELNNYTPSYIHKELISDTLNYQKVQFIYTSIGNEKYIYIGNITGSYPSTLTRTSEFGSQYSKFGVNGRFMIIDDVSIIPLDTNEICCIQAIQNQTIINKELDLSLKDTVLIHQEFYKNDYDFTAYNELILNKLKSNDIEFIIIEGYTDKNYKSDYNMKLAKRRADNYKYFLKKNNVNCDIITISKGEVITENIDNSRRIDIYIVKR